MTIVKFTSASSWSILWIHLVMWFWPWTSIQLCSSILGSKKEEKLLSRSRRLLWRVALPSLMTLLWKSFWSLLTLFLKSKLTTKMSLMPYLRMNKFKSPKLSSKSKIPMPVSFGKSSKSSSKSSKKVAKKEWDTPFHRLFSDSSKSQFNFSAVKTDQNQKDTRKFLKWLENSLRNWVPSSQSSLSNFIFNFCSWSITLTQLQSIMMNGLTKLLVNVCCFMKAKLLILNKSNCSLSWSSTHAWDSTAFQMKTTILWSATSLLIAQRFLKRTNNAKFYSAVVIFSQILWLMSTESMRFWKDALNWQTLQ